MTSKQWSFAKWTVKSAGGLGPEMLWAERYLSAADWFLDLVPEEAAEFNCALAAVRSYARESVIYAPGATCEQLFILKRGAVQIYRLTSAGRQQVIVTLRPGSLFGEMSCVGQSMYGAFAKAAEDSLLCALSRADVERLLQARPRLARRIIEAVSRRVIEAERRLAGLALKNEAQK